ncbi:hypothetical protein [Paracidovorax wautersii]|uniref:YfdX protein n=1 Tax=Paracidovorax wautersii TaxID=1177982 RepID=A0A1I2BL42_9BURK|nr:hypothetical protein [Paracidovorax wautersii]SFE56637.1 hypothetical protein SAMN04489711_10347 [Paracidovorax wautersii]
MPSLRRHSAAIAVLALFAQFPVASMAQTPAAAPSAAASQPASAAAPAAASDWIQYDDLSLTPVVDDVSRSLAAARTALAAKDNAKAAESLQAAARALHAQAEQAAKADKAQAATDARQARDVQARMAALVKQIDHTADQVRAGKIHDTAGLDRTLTRAQRADLDRRWVLTDVESWYPVTQEPQRHFTAALAEFAKKDYQSAALDVRQASALLRLEATRAHGDARKALQGAEAQLDKTATALSRGKVKTERDLTTVFARADHALALAYHAKATESLAHKAYHDAGYELKAAAQGLENAATWSGDEARGAAGSAAHDARDVGDKLLSGARWTQHELTHGFDAIRNGLARLEHAGGGSAAAATAASPTASSAAPAAKSGS